jgi:hypothetical protein
VGCGEKARIKNDRAGKPETKKQHIGSISTSAFDQGHLRESGF